MTHHRSFRNVIACLCMIVNFSASAAAQAQTENIVIVDDKDAQRIGAWTESSWSRDRHGDACLHDNKSGKGEKTVIWTPTIKEAGDYEVRIAYNANGGRARNIPVLVRHSRGETTVALDQTQPPKFGNLFQPIGRFHFDAGARGSVTLSNVGTTGHVIADAVAFVPVALAEKELKEMPQPGRHVIVKPERVRAFSGIYPHLASFNEHGECGTGAVVPSADTGSGSSPTPPTSQGDPRTASARSRPISR